MNCLVGPALVVLALSGCAPPLPDGPATTAWFGDPHVHTGASGDGCSSDMGQSLPLCGPALDVAGSAADVGLDWLALADHTDSAQARTDADALTDWRAVLDAGLASTETLVIAGSETDPSTPDGPLGHRTLLLFADDLGGLTRDDLAPSGDSTGLVDDCAAYQAWADGLDRFGPTILIPHHPAAERPAPVDWNCTANLDQAVEVYSHWGNSRSWRSAAEPWADYDPLGFEAADTHVKGTAEAMLVEHPDLRLGFVAGTDGHRSTPGDTCARHTPEEYGGGLTAAVLPDGDALTRESLYDAFVARHTYATTGPHLPLDVDVFNGETRVGGMGDEVSIGETDVVTVRVRLGEPETWDREVVGVWIVQPGAQAPEEARGIAWRTEPGVFVGQATVSPTANGTWLYVEVVLEGDTSHPAGCIDEPESDWPDDPSGYGPRQPGS